MALPHDAAGRDRVRVPRPAARRRAALAVDELVSFLAESAASPSSSSPRPFACCPTCPERRAARSRSSLSASRSSRPRHRLCRPATSEEIDIAPRAIRPAVHRRQVGARRRPSEQIEVVSPVTEEAVASVPAASVEDVDRAVAAARRAFSGWSTTPLAERVEVLRRLRELLADTPRRWPGSSPRRWAARSPSRAPSRSSTRSAILDAYMDAGRELPVPDGAPFDDGPARW